MKNISISVGFEHDNTFKELDKVFARNDFIGKYQEEIMQLYPFLFYDNTNVKVIHITITGQHVIEEILKIADKNISIAAPYLSLSLLWNFPRKKYNETMLWACLSGFFYDVKNNKFVDGNRLVVSNNLVNESASKATDEIIEYITAEIRGAISEQP